MTSDRPIIIKKVKKAAHGHHGGAWKIAYADFVTAMMAFFLLLWLLSMATPEQKKGLADYFSPASVSETKSGAGGVLAGRQFDTDGAKSSNADTDKRPGTAAAKTEGLAILNEGSGEAGNPKNAGATAQDILPKDIKSAFDQQFQGAAASIRHAWQAMPNITDLENNLRVEETEEGLNIRIMDTTGRPMFPKGSKYPYEITRDAIAAVAPILRKLPNQIRIAGHTAAGGTYIDPRYGPWDLSSDRANAVRVILGEFGTPDDQFQSVNGRSTSEPLLPNDPYLSANERVEITLLRTVPPVPPDLKF